MNTQYVHRYVHRSSAARLPIAPPPSKKNTQYIHIYIYIYIHKKN